MLSIEQVKHIAKLARLGITDAEADKFAKQLSNILGYVDLLNEVNVDGVELTSQVTGLQNVMREDTVKPFCTKEEMLGTTELPVQLDQIKVKPVMNQ
jgi:aspartyl-tRNA(Asn)/glutamyl-tRNA(Gln) amidotransferase subunit C